jgi:hypothetical protein
MVSLLLFSIIAPEHAFPRAGIMMAAGTIVIILLIVVYFLHTALLWRRTREK